MHIPFCRAKCAYCDFNSYAGQEALLPAYVAALEQEIQRVGPSLAAWYSGQAGSAGRSYVIGQVNSLPLICTVYFGGGTPSLLSLGQLERLISAIAGTFALAPEVEITLEANPGTVDLPYLQGLLKLGVNRLSLGVQSLNDGLLQAIGRIHSPAQAQEAYLWARRAGFTNINLDFIYGLPGQDLANWQATLRQALSWQPEHLSLYALTLEENTPLGRQVAAGQIALPDEDAVADMYELAEGMLGEAGYIHYEISNWAAEAPRYLCRHNLLYWRNLPYLGLGAGAHSSLPIAVGLPPFLEGTMGASCGAMAEGGPPIWARWHNVALPAEYIARMQGDVSPVAGVELLSPQTVMAETMFLGLRLVEEGVNFAEFRERFGLGPEQVYGAELRELQQLGLLEVDALRARLTPRGRLLGNEVFRRFVSLE